MKMHNLYVAVLAMLLSASVVAQKRGTTQSSSSSNQAKAPAATTKSPQKTLSDGTDSLKKATKDLKTSMNDVKTSFSTLFGSKRDTIAIAIANIEYDDASLAGLKENLKKLKGVKAVMMQYKASNALLEVSFKGKATDLWDRLPAEVKSPFKLVEAGDNTITLENKAVKDAVVHQ
jgi:hypothetical protein